MKLTLTDKKLLLGTHREALILILCVIPIAVYLQSPEQNIKLLMTALVGIISIAYLVILARAKSFTQATPIGRVIFAVLSIISLFILLLLMIFRSTVPVTLSTLGTVFEVNGPSMSPTFKEGEFVELIPAKEFKRGDTVMYQYRSTRLVGRIVALPEETFQISNCQILIKGQVISESYLAEGACTSEGRALKEGMILQTKANYYLILGDNRSLSTDSRDFGPVAKANIIGLVTKK